MTSMTTHDADHKPTNKAKPWLLGTALLVLAALVVFVSVKVLSPDDTDESTDVAPAAPAPEHSGDSEDTDVNAKGWDSSIADVFGRSIRVPANGVGIALGEAEKLKDTQCDVGAPAELTIQRTSGTQTIWSEDIGPSSVNEGEVPVGYARSAEAAMVAAANDLALFYSGGDSTLEVTKSRLSSPNLDAMIAEAEKGSEKDPHAVNQPAPSAFKITSCDENRVIGDLAMPLPTDATGDPNAPTWGVMRISSVWENGDWKTEIGGVPQPLEDEIDGLEGWQQWVY